MASIHRIVVTLAVLAFARPAIAQEHFIEDYATSIERLLESKFADGNSGMVIGLLEEHGTRIFSAGRLDNGTDQRINGDTIFELGSVTKVFTSLLFLDAVRRGEMELEDPVAKYLPAGTKLPTHGGQPLTLLHLAVQDSGLPRHPDNLWDHAAGPLSLEEVKKGSDTYTLDKLYAFLSSYKLPEAPGTRFYYSNVGMALLGHAIERRTGRDYESLVAERICRPLHMEHTRITLNADEKSRLATGHLVDGTPSEHWQLKAMASAGSFLSTAKDMLKFLSANLGFTTTHLTPLLEEMQVPRHTGSLVFGNTAMPWVDQGVYHPPGAELWGHAGGGYGTIAFVGFDKKKRRGVVVLTNQMRVHPSPIGWTILQGMPLTPENVTYAVREIVGIGTGLAADEDTGAVQITRVFPQSPAGAAGLTAGLTIRKVNGVAVQDKSLQEVLGLIAGPAGTKVQLELVAPDGESVRTVELTREKFLTTS